MVYIIESGICSLVVFAILLVFILFYYLKFDKSLDGFKKDFKFLVIFSLTIAVITFLVMLRTFTYSFNW